MNNSKEIKIIFVYLLFVTIIGCNKTDGKYLLNNTKTLHENPYDFVGQMHNVGLDYIINKHFNQSKVFVADEITMLNNIIKSTEEFYLSYRVNLYPKYNNIDTALLFKLLKDNLNNLSQCIIQEFPANYNCGKNMILNDPNTTMNEKKYFNQIFNLLNTPDRSLDMTIVSNVKAIESTIIQDQTLTDQEKAVLLSSTSVLKYSAQYWYNVLNNTNSPWFKLTFTKGQVPAWYEKYRKHSVDILQSDFEGAATGAVIGLIGGAAGGPTTAISGAVTVGGAGALGSSAFTAGKKIWNWLSGH